jgi:hypothetical protein
VTEIASVVHGNEDAHAHAHGYGYGYGYEEDRALVAEGATSKRLPAFQHFRKRLVFSEDTIRRAAGPSLTLRRAAARYAPPSGVAFHRGRLRSCLSGEPSQHSARASAEPMLRLSH